LISPFISKERSCSTKEAFFMERDFQITPSAARQRGKVATSAEKIFHVTTRNTDNDRAGNWPDRVPPNIYSTG